MNGTMLEVGMRILSSRTCSIFGLCGGILIALALPVGARAGTVTACTAIDLCYCVNTDVRIQIDANVARVRQLIAEQRKQDKAIGYMSIPLSTAGGSYFGVNTDVAALTKDNLEKRFGANSAWILNPGAEGNLPPAATGADYMFMWTTILEGPKGLGEDFDFFYFVGPSAFRKFFGLDGTGDMEKIDAYFDKRSASDPNLQKAVDEKKVSKRTFRDYYALRASVAFSYGSHDEWNIARIINERRRGADDFGIANQLSILFDGRAAAPGAAEASIAGGDVGRCIN
jgi:hypothetical protein